MLCLLFFFFSCSAAHLDLHSFPTRRSSDLASAASFPFSCACFIRASTVSGTDTPGTSFARNSAFRDRKSTRLNSSHLGISYAVFCLKKKKIQKYRKRE